MAAVGLRRFSTSSSYFTMKRVFTLEDGRSAFGEIKVPLDQDLGNRFYVPASSSISTFVLGEIGIMSQLVPGSGIIFRRTPSDYNFSSHNAPREQVIVNLNAGVDITTCRDGELRLAAGEAFFVEDLTGNGHVSKSIEGQYRDSLFLPVSRENLEKSGCEFFDEITK